MSVFIIGIGDAEAGNFAAEAGNSRGVAWKFSFESKGAKFPRN